MKKERGIASVRSAELQPHPNRGIHAQPPEEKQHRIDRRRHAGAVEYPPGGRGKDEGVPARHARPQPGALLMIVDRAMIKDHADREPGGPPQRRSDRDTGAQPTAGDRLGEPAPGWLVAGGPPPAHAPAPPAQTEPLPD